MLPKLRKALSAKWTCADGLTSRQRKSTNYRESIQKYKKEAKAEHG
ncbi:MAG: hypothetical protein HFH80_06930 [Lachnospiraceae bacterium]|nr:hypothetical protein [Lachnospiraceae bacterium]